jgi:hypothetical protein
MFSHAPPRLFSGLARHRPQDRIVRGLGSP